MTRPTMCSSQAERTPAEPACVSFLLSDSQSAHKRPSGCGCVGGEWKRATMRATCNHIAFLGCRSYITTRGISRGYILLQPDAAVSVGRPPPSCVEPSMRRASSRTSAGRAPGHPPWGAPPSPTARWSRPFVVSISSACPGSIAHRLNRQPARPEALRAYKCATTEYDLHAGSEGV